MACGVVEVVVMMVKNAKWKEKKVRKFKRFLINSYI